jgi:tetratricopeptide (TPR) repeat protein
MKGQLFVGRQRQLEELEGYLERTLAGQGQVCFVTGQAGCGKTALVHQFLQQALAANPDLIVALGSCNAQTGIGDPYLPFREALAMLTGDAAAQQSASRISPENANRLRTVLVRSVQVLVEVAPDLVGIFVPGVSLLGALGKAVVEKVGWMDQLDELAKRKERLGAPVAEQSRIFEQYTTFVQRLSTKTPLILFLDDLQWADTASLGLSFHLARHLESSRILILGAYRPNDVAMGRDGGRHPLEPVVNELTRYYGDVSIDLDAIPEVASRRFVDAVLDAEPNHLGEEFRQALFHKTGGHALFTVELIRTLQERGDLVRDGDGRWVEDPLLDWDALPARVEGVIGERIARLSEELRELLRVGSVEGEQFTAEVVARVQKMSERQAVRELSGDLQRRHRLVSAEGLVQLGHLRLSLYRFLHNLFQQYLYGNLDEAERTFLHRDVGAVIEALFVGQVEEVAAQLARHFEEGGVPDKAAAYRLQAGNQARFMSANQEAINHLTRGLELLSEVPSGAERMQLELGLQTSLGMTLITTQGYASPAVEKALVRARDVCQALGDPPQAVPILTGLALFRMVRGELLQAHQEGEQLLRLAERIDDDGPILAAHALLGTITVYLGRLEDARVHLERAIALYDPPKHGELAYLYGQDPCVTAIAYLAWVLWLQGHPDQAVVQKDKALALATEIDQPYSLVVANLWAAELQEMMRRWAECEAYAETASRLANEGHFLLWQAMSAIIRATPLAHRGRTEEAMAEMGRGLDAFEATGSQVAVPYHLSRMAEIHLIAGKKVEGLRWIEDSLAGDEEVWWRPEQLRLRAELLLLTPGNEAEAEDLLRHALGVARGQGSKSLELRAAMSLGRLLQQLGRAVEGRELLAACFGWFTEGLDTPDLREARELLDQLHTDAGSRSGEPEG